MGEFIWPGGEKYNGEKIINQVYDEICFWHDGVTARKLAIGLGLSHKQIDRAIFNLKHDGLIEQEGMLLAPDYEATLWVEAKRTPAEWLEFNSRQKIAA